MIRDRSTPPDGATDRPRFGMGPVNLGLLAAGVAAVVVGYVLLDRGSTVAAPLLLVLGYVVLVPAALLIGLRGAGDGGTAPGE